MSLMRNAKSSLVLITVFSVVPELFVVSNMCTRGADIMYCHEIIAESDGGTAVRQEYKPVYTVHECRDICDIAGCIAFDYQVRAAERQQVAICFGVLHKTL